MSNVNKFISDTHKTVSDAIKVFSTLLNTSAVFVCCIMELFIKFRVIISVLLIFYVIQFSFRCIVVIFSVMSYFQILCNFLSSNSHGLLTLIQETAVKSH